MALEVFFNGSDKSDHVERRLRRQSDARRSSSCELVKPSPNVRRKKLDRRKHPCSFFGPRCSFTGASDLSLPVTLPLSSLISIAPADPRNVPPPLRLLDDPQDVGSATYLALRRFIVPRRSAIASFARAESAARVASSRRTAASRRRVVSCWAWRSR